METLDGALKSWGRKGDVVPALPSATDNRPLPTVGTRDINRSTRRRAFPRIVNDVQVAPPKISRNDVTPVLEPVNPADFLEVSMGVSPVGENLNSDADWSVARNRRNRATPNNRPRSGPPDSTRSDISTYLLLRFKGMFPPVDLVTLVDVPLLPQSRSNLILKTSLTQIFYVVRSEMSLSELGLDATKIKEAANGGLLFEVSGPDNN